MSLRVCVPERQRDGKQRRRTHRDHAGHLGNLAAKMIPV
jgi:hypothetical protein